jgi:hypothetical protein
LSFAGFTLFSISGIKMGIPMQLNQQASSREAVKLLTERIEKHDSSSLSIDQLSQFGICFEKLVLDNPEKKGSVFFTLYPRHLLPEPDDALRERCPDDIEYPGLSCEGQFGVYSGSSHGRTGLTRIYTITASVSLEVVRRAP